LFNSFGADGISIQSLAAAANYIHQQNARGQKRKKNKFGSFATHIIYNAHNTLFQIITISVTMLSFRTAFVTNKHGLEKISESNINNGTSADTSFQRCADASLRLLTHQQENKLLFSRKLIFTCKYVMKCHWPSVLQKPPDG